MTFDANAQLLRREELEDLVSLDANDVLLIAHGWLTDRRQADTLVDYYRAALAPMPVRGIYWPSTRGAAQGLVKAGVDATSYYTMKKRAGEIGTLGLAPWLLHLRRENPRLRLHLAGHSFGARLVTAAAAALPTGFLHSMTLIQAAFSQFAFSPEGAFHEVVGRRPVLSPILATFSQHDQAVGLAYPLASRLGRQNASSLGGADDPYGGLGHNGAAGVPVIPLECRRQIALYRNAPLLNLDCSSAIRSHSDVFQPALAEAIRLVAASSPAP